MTPHHVGWERINDQWLAGGHPISEENGVGNFFNFVPLSIVVVISNRVANVDQAGFSLCLDRSHLEATTS